MTWEWILLLVLVLVLIAALPVYPYSRAWGYWPGGVVALIVIIFVVLLIMGLV